jgi:hypothetical protein
LLTWRGGQSQSGAVWFTANFETQQIKKLDLCREWMQKGDKDCASLLLNFEIARRRKWANYRGNNKNIRMKAVLLIKLEKIKK